MRDEYRKRVGGLMLKWRAVLCMAVVELRLFPFNYVIFFPGILGVVVRQKGERGRWTPFSGYPRKPKRAFSDPNLPAIRNSCFSVGGNSSGGRILSGIRRQPGIAEGRGEVVCGDFTGRWREFLSRCGRVRYWTYQGECTG